MHKTPTNQQLFDLPFGTNQITINNNTLKCFKALFDRQDAKRLIRYLSCYDIHPQFNNVYIIKCKNDMSMIIIIASERNYLWQTWDKALILNRISPLSIDQVMQRQYATYAFAAACD
jgi:hypothetical protein